MAYQLSASQLSSYRKEGHFSAKDLFSENDISIILDSKEGMNTFQEDPNLKKVITKRGLGKLFFEITEKSLHRLVQTRTVSANQEILLQNISIEPIYIALFFNYDDHLITFFNQTHSHMTNSEGLLLVYGDPRARYVKKDHDINSAYLLNKGYANGDKLPSEEYPLLRK